MIILKGVPGLTNPDIMTAISDLIPLDKVTTGYGGIVVDERTALHFLQRYFTAVDAGASTTEDIFDEEITIEEPEPAQVKTRGTRRR